MARVVILLAFLSLPAHFSGNIVQATTPPQSGDKSPLIPGALLKWPDLGSDYAVLVDKSAQRAFVYHRNNPFAPVKSFTCSTGENEGQKEKEKDRKTPEGIYFFTHVHEKKDLAPIYGTKAFPLDYPNPIDRREGREGYGIWFHGLNKPLKPNDTNGCVALENQDIEDLAAYIRLHDTPAIIASKLEMMDPDRAQKEAKELEKIIETWRRAWEGKEIDKYMTFYSPRFTTGDKDWQGWKQYKARLAKTYKDIRVDIANLRLLKNNGVALAVFDQRYSSSSFDSVGEKRLYLIQNSSQWRIIEENFRESERAHLTFKTRPAGPTEAQKLQLASAATPPEPPKAEPPRKPVNLEAPKGEPAPPAKAAAPEAPKVEAASLPQGPGNQGAEARQAVKKQIPPKPDEIKAFLDSWKRAWEQKDLKAYLSCYDPGFRSRGMDLKRWKNHRETLNQSHRSVRVDIRDLTIQQTSESVAKVRFKQHYQADEYRDVGVKNILLMKKGAHWKIKREDWSPLRKGARL